MAGRLPGGLLTTNTEVEDHLRSAEQIDAEELRRLWNGLSASVVALELALPNVLE